MKQSSLYSLPDIYINKVMSAEVYAVADHAYQFLGDGYGGEEPYSWNWTFGDGNTSTARNATNTYGEIGNYTVTLNATDDTSNITGNASVTVKVVTLNADFNTSYSYGAAPDETIYFNGTSDGVYAITDRTWNFSDGTIQRICCRSYFYNGYIFGAQRIHRFDIFGKTNII